MSEKTIKLIINEENFPMLFNIKDDRLGELCYNIFQAGYESYFGGDYRKDNIRSTVTQSKNRILNNIDTSTDSIKYDIQKIGTQLNQIDMSDQIDRFSCIMEELLGISNNSTKKGKFTEDLIYESIKNRFPDYVLQITRGQAHHADAILSIPVNNNRLVQIMVEIKNYVRPVDTDEIIKLKNDMKHTGIKHSIFISLKSGFIGKKQMGIDEFEHNGELYTIIYLPNVNTSFDKIESSILLTEKLIDFSSYYNSKKYQYKWLQTNITEHLSKLDKIHTQYSGIRIKFHKMEKNIRESLNEYYIILRTHEVELKQQIDEIWRDIKNELGILNNNTTNKSDELIKATKHKNLSEIMEVLRDCGYAIHNTHIKNMYHCTLNNLNSKLKYSFGIIIKRGKVFEIVFTDPSIKFSIQILGNIKNDLEYLRNNISQHE